MTELTMGVGVSVGTPDQPIVLVAAEGAITYPQGLLLREGFTYPKGALVGLENASFLAPTRVSNLVGSWAANAGGEIAIQVQTPALFQESIGQAIAYKIGSMGGTEKDIGLIGSVVCTSLIVVVTNTNSHDLGLGPVYVPDGSEDAIGILAEPHNLTAMDTYGKLPQGSVVQEANVYMAGRFYKSQVIGFNTNAIVNKLGVHARTLGDLLYLA